MEEFFLGCFLASNELNIIYKKDIYIAVLVMEWLCRSAFNGCYKFICETVTSDIQNF